MKKSIIFFMSFGIISLVRAECVATGYLIGSQVPEFTVIQTESLEPHWQEFKAKYGVQVSVSYIPRFADRPIQDQCLVEFSKAAAEREESHNEKLVLQQACSEFTIGEHLRLFVYSYCVEIFDLNRPPDLFTDLAYRHAQITESLYYGL